MKAKRHFRPQTLTILLGAIALTALAACSGTQNRAGKESMNIVGNFMGAMSKGNMKTLTGLMADDMIWQNEGDSRLPWIGKHIGKEKILKNFMPKMGANLKVTAMKPYAMFAKGDQVAVFGTWRGKMVKSGKSVESSFAILIEVDRSNKKIKRWWFFEDSYAVSRAYRR